MNTRISRLFTAMLCTLVLVFSTAGASALTGDSIGTLQVPSKGKVTVNNRAEGNGSEIHGGDVIKTGSNEVRVLFPDGGILIVYVNTQVRVYLDGDSVVTSVRMGSVKYIPARRPGQLDNPAIVDGGGEDFLPPLSNNAAVGSGNFPFPSIGGGGSSNNNRTLPITNASGVIIGYVVTDGNGRVIAFTDPSGRVLATTPADGTPLSVVFGPGATF